MLGLVVWRLVAGGLYALALLLITPDLSAAVLTLCAALLCLPAMRSAFRRRTGWRLGGACCAAGAAALMLAAILSVGTEQTPPIGPVDGGVVLATAQAAKP